MIRTITIDPVVYQSTQPFPYAVQDDILEPLFAAELQQEIMLIPKEAWDRYQNPFEAKDTLRDKWNLPPRLRALFEELESDTWMAQMSQVTGYRLQRDPTRNFWGVHTYHPSDKLDIHVDAGLHPTTKQKKQITLGIYLSANWKSEYGCELEVWRGSSAASASPVLYEKADSIVPQYNRLIVFTCNDVAWHGNPEPCRGPADAKRIFLTMSYLSEITHDENKRTKALFIARPTDPPDEEKERLRQLRADPERYKEIYRIEVTEVL